MLAIVDTGPLYAVVDADDQDHERCRAALERADLELVVPALVVAEAAYLIGRRLGPGIEAAFVRSLADFEVEAPRADDWPEIADLVDRYGDFPLGTTDASVAVLAGRLDTNLILTLDRRHFGALRSPDGGVFTLLPD
jgi:predicted nucleic acid-binding protein